MREALMQKDSDELYSTLLEVDKEAAEKIHKNNKKRVVRALEIYYSSGATKTAQDINSKKEESPYEVLYFVIGFKSREVLYERINRRVDLMVEAGLIDEARKNLSKEKATSAQAIGHKELQPYFSGEKSLGQALDDLKRETRRYAKRQITWFKRRKNAIWLYADEEGADIVKAAIDKSREFLNG